MQRATFSMSRLAATRMVSVGRPAVMKQTVRYLAVDGSPEFEKRRKAAEDKYFREVNEEAIKKYAEKLHEKELRELLTILGPVELDSSTLHKILDWKHKHH